MMIKKRGQTYSFDIIIGSIIFVMLLVLFIYYSYSNVGVQVTNEDLKQQATSFVLKTHRSSDPGKTGYFIENNMINNTLLEELTGYSYDDLKDIYGMYYDFCIYFEDEDGDLIDLDMSSGWAQYSIGSSRAEFTIYNSDGSYNRTTPCGTKESV